MALDPNPNGIIQGPSGEIDILLIFLSGKRRAAGLAPSDRVRRPQLECGSMVLTAQPMKVILPDDDNRISGAAAGLSAVRAVAHPDAIYLPFNFVAEGSAEATSLFATHHWPAIPEIPSRDT